MKYRFVLPRGHATILREWARLDAARTQGRWDMSAMDFPEGDPDRAFAEFMSEHSTELLAALNDIFVVEGMP